MNNLDDVVMIRLPDGMEVWTAIDGRPTTKPATVVLMFDRDTAEALAALYAAERRGAA